MSALKKQIKEANFVTLIIEAYKRLPLLRGQDSSSMDDASEDNPSE
jgi:hypothetical protein